MFAEGQLVERSTIKTYVIERDGYLCRECNTSEWRGKPLSLILDHIDGNVANNMPVNFRLVCPNCASQLPTFGARNKGNGRKARGLPLR